MRFHELNKLFSNLDPSIIEEIVLKYPYRGDPWPVLVELWEKSATQVSV